MWKKNTPVKPFNHTCEISAHFEENNWLSSDTIIIIHKFYLSCSAVVVSLSVVSFSVVVTVAFPVVINEKTKMY